MLADDRAAMHGESYRDRAAGIAELYRGVEDREGQIGVAIAVEQHLESWNRFGGANLAKNPDSSAYGLRVRMLGGAEELFDVARLIEEGRWIASNEGRYRRPPRPGSSMIRRTTACTKLLLESRSHQPRAAVPADPIAITIVAREHRTAMERMRLGADATLHSMTPSVVRRHEAATVRSRARAASTR